MASAVEDELVRWGADERELGSEAFGYSETTAL